MARNANYEAPDYGTFFIPLERHPSQVQVLLNISIEEAGLAVISRHLFESC
jgi:hypothetical protein